MTTWEYRTHSTVMRLPSVAPNDRDALGAAGDQAAAAWLAELNALGADGWEAVGPLDLAGSTSAGGIEARSVLLRRRVRDAAAVTGD